MGFLQLSQDEMPKPSGMGSIIGQVKRPLLSTSTQQVKTNHDDKEVFELHGVVEEKRKFLVSIKTPRTNWHFAISKL
jgi:hypothetical protein